MLSLCRRVCELGGDHSGKTKEKNGEVTKFLTFELQSIELDSLELCAFLSEPHAYHSLYNNGPNGITPFLKCFKALELDAAIEGAYLALYWGLDDTTMVFTECKLSKIELVLCDGGLTKLSCKVTTAPVLDESLPALFEKFGEKVECELRAEPPGAQQDLPLNRHGEGEQSERRKPRRRRGEAEVAH